MSRSVRTVTLADRLADYLAMKRKLGYEFHKNECALRKFVRFTEERNEPFIRSGTAIEWAGSQASAVRKLHMLHAFSCWVHAEDPRHEVPHPDALGRLSERRPQPFLLSVKDIGKLLEAALCTEPAGTITPLTWHYLFGLLAVTGMRISEALKLTLDDITPDGLIIRNTKFRKSRMIVLHPTTWDALRRYLAVRRKTARRNGHLFVLARTGRPPHRNHATNVFRHLAEQTGIRKPDQSRGPTPHSLRHSFAVRSIESLGADSDPSRHMLALATYLGHAEISDTYWYLEATPILLDGIARVTERSHAHRRGGSHD